MGRGRGATAALLLLAALALGAQCGKPQPLARVDADGDGQVTTSDESLVASCQGADPASVPACASSDVDRNGAVNATDLARVQTTLGEDVCNEFVEFCDRGLDEVVTATAHNAYSAVNEGYLLNVTANHYEGIEFQLEAGYRGLALDVMRWDDPAVPGGETLHLCHGVCSTLMGFRDAVDGLVGIRDFLLARPGDVVVLFFEHIDPPDEVLPRVGPDITAFEVEAVFAAAGLLASAPALRPYVHTPGTAWPDLATLIADNTRLVVFNQEFSEPAVPFYHYMWSQLVWDTDWSNAVPEDFDCDLLRGSTNNDLFFMNHFLTGTFTGQPDLAALVNPTAFVQARGLECWAAQQQLPNFIAVDYTTVGNPLAAVDELNRRAVKGLLPY